MSTIHISAQRAGRCTRAGLWGDRRRAGRGLGIGLAAVLAGLMAADAATAGLLAYRIEEDWVVEIATPDSGASAPQIITAMSSTAELADVHAVFELNHTSLPSFSPGGLQLQVWSGESLLAYKNSSKTGTLSTGSEVITYTQVMKLSAGSVEFSVVNGASTTWGSFGTTGKLKASLPTTQLSLSLYSPQTSVANSYVGFAKHRVKNVALKEVRWYDALGVLLQRDTTERVVHQLN